MLLVSQKEERNTKTDYFIAKYQNSSESSLEELSKRNKQMWVDKDHGVPGELEKNTEEETDNESANRPQDSLGGKMVIVSRLLYEASLRSSIVFHIWKLQEHLLHVEWR